MKKILDINTAKKCEHFLHVSTWGNVQHGGEGRGKKEGELFVALKHTVGSCLRLHLWGRVAEIQTNV